MARVFSSCQVVLDLTTSVSFKKKQEVKKKVTDNGGIISYIVTKKSTHVVCNDAEKADVSYKCKMAQKYSIPVVSVDYLYDCVDKGRLLNPDDYIIVGKTKSQELSAGKIVASKNQTSEKKKKGLSINVGGVRAWPYKDKNAPWFNENSYEVAKYSILKKYEKTRETTLFYVLEIHVIEEHNVRVDADQNQSDVCRFRVFSHFGNLHDIQEGKPGTVECRYVRSSDEALAVYAYMYKQHTDPPHGMTRTHRLLSRHVGSPKFQMMVADLGLEQEMSQEVGTLVEHMWTEAAGELEDVISVPLKSLKLEQVEKAEALLLQLSKSGDDNEIKALLDEFYSALPHNPQHVVRKVNISWLAKKQDVCQMIKDMASVSEATNWSMRGASDAKYRALRCGMEHLPDTHPEYKSIRQHITQSLQGDQDMTIHNVFAVHRQVEADNFKELLPTRLLFHASKAQQFVGILSRGLLLPKVVVDDFGGQRSDAGMLGSGIYFASAASTCKKYSVPSSTRGTRMMVVNEVAIGKCQKYYQFDQSLTSPPEGYDSVHGVAKTDSVNSDFTEDEYVVYNTCQQKMKYLVEFTVGSEIPHHQVVSLSQEIDQEDHELTTDKIDLEDVQNITDPMSKVTPGLVADVTGGNTVELRAVHIRAKLMDLAAEVIVLQEYKNNSTDKLEAKYIFPLDEAAAVCGFEAFINGKHIIGEVKEKETAHKEYKQAISEGHGAYLMDQDEETPDVFTVSVGNIPPGASVLIKITYVSELQVEDEMISFRLPGSVAPWKKQETKATLSELQKEDIDRSKLNTVEVSVEMPFEIRSIQSPTHIIEMKKTATKAVIRLAPNQFLEDGFHLLIGLAEIHVPRMWVEKQEGDRHEQACMLTFYPEFEASDDIEAEVILVLDLSNSMKGTTLTEAKKILLLTLQHMPKNWKFNVVIFGTAYRELFPACQPIKKQFLSAAENFIQACCADLGNTEVYRPLHSFYLLKPESSLRNIFLVSDGHINNEETTLNAVYKNSHHTRIFTFGVSSTQNRHLLRALARVGAGAFESFDSKSKSKWEGKVKSQLSKAGQPGLSSVSVAWEQHDTDVQPPKQAPKQITALFSGSRQVVYGFVDNCLMATLKAEIAGQEISTLVSTSELNVTKGKILHRLTAKAVIRDWEDGVLSPDRINHEVMKMNMKNFVIELSKEYCIVTQLTSFVAVEKREKDETFVDFNPEIEELLMKEDVDILQYMSYTDAKGKRLDSLESLEEDGILDNCIAIAASLNNEYSSSDSTSSSEDVYEACAEYFMEDFAYSSTKPRGKALEITDEDSESCDEEMEFELFGDDDDQDIYDDALCFEQPPLSAMSEISVIGLQVEKGKTAEESESDEREMGFGLFDDEICDAISYAPPSFPMSQRSATATQVKKDVQIPILEEKVKMGSLLRSTAAEEMPMYQRRRKMKKKSPLEREKMEQAYDMDDITERSYIPPRTRKVRRSIAGVNVPPSTELDSIVGGAMDEEASVPRKTTPVATKSKEEEISKRMYVPESQILGLKDIMRITVDEVNSREEKMEQLKVLARQDLQAYSALARELSESGDEEKRYSQVRMDDMHEFRARRAKARKEKEMEHHRSEDSLSAAVPTSSSSPVRESQFSHQMEGAPLLHAKSRSISPLMVKMDLPQPPPPPPVARMKQGSTPLASTMDILKPQQPASRGMSGMVPGIGYCMIPATAPESNTPQPLALGSMPQSGFGGSMPPPPVPLMNMQSSPAFGGSMPPPPVPLMDMQQQPVFGDSMPQSSVPSSSKKPPPSLGGSSMLPPPIFRRSKQPPPAFGGSSMLPSHISTRGKQPPPAFISSMPPPPVSTRGKQPPPALICGMPPTPVYTRGKQPLLVSGDSNMPPPPVFSRNMPPHPMSGSMPQSSRTIKDMPVFECSDMAFKKASLPCEDVSTNLSDPTELTSAIGTRMRLEVRQENKTTKRTGFKSVVKLRKSVDEKTQQEKVDRIEDTIEHAYDSVQQGVTQLSKAKPVSWRSNWTCGIDPDVKEQERGIQQMAQQQMLDVRKSARSTTYRSSVRGNKQMPQQQMLDVRKSARSIRQSSSDMGIVDDSDWIVDRSMEDSTPLLMVDTDMEAHKLMFDSVNVIDSSQKTMKCAADLGIGSEIPKVQKQFIPGISTGLLDELLNLQDSDGHWKFTMQLEQILGFSGDLCLNGLYKAGLRSLGVVLAIEIQALVITVLVILILMKIHAPRSFPIDFSQQTWKDTVNNIINSLPTDKFQPMIIKAMSYCEKAEKSYAWVPGMLELGHNWFDVAQKMMQI